MSTFQAKPKVTQEVASTRINSPTTGRLKERQRKCVKLIGIMSVERNYIHGITVPSAFVQPVDIGILNLL